MVSGFARTAPEHVGVPHETAGLALGSHRLIPVIAPPGR